MTTKHPVVVRWSYTTSGKQRVETLVIMTVGLAENRIWVFKNGRKKHSRIPRLGYPIAGSTNEGISLLSVLKNCEEFRSMKVRSIQITPKRRALVRAGVGDPRADVLEWILDSLAAA